LKASATIKVAMQCFKIFGEEMPPPLVARLIKFWWESGLSSASRNHLTTFCRPFAHYAYL